MVPHQIYQTLASQDLLDLLAVARRHDMLAEARCNRRAAGPMGCVA
jgi:hypothetical protein